MLSWWRTGLALVAIGITLGKLFTEDNTMAEGFVFVTMGFIYSMLSLLRYRHSLDYMKQGKFAASAWMVTATSATTIVGYILLIIFRSIAFFGPKP